MIVTRLQVKTNAVKLIAIAFIGMVSTLSLVAQGNEIDAKPQRFASVVINGKQAGQVIFCMSSDENTAANRKQKSWTAANYRLKVWQLMQGQSAETAMASNKTIVTTLYHAINTKGAGGDRMLAGNDSEAIKACSESLQEANNSAGKVKGSKSGVSADANGQYTIRVAGTDKWQPQNLKAFVVDNFLPCDDKNSCDYVLTVEVLDANGKPIDPNATPEVYTLVRNNKGWNLKGPIKV